MRSFVAATKDLPRSSWGFFDGSRVSGQIVNNRGRAADVLSVQVGEVEVGGSIQYRAIIRTDNNTEPTTRYYAAKPNPEITLAPQGTHETSAIGKVGETIVANTSGKTYMSALGPVALYANSDALLKATCFAVEDISSELMITPDEVVLKESRTPTLAGSLIGYKQQETLLKTTVV